MKHKYPYYQGICGIDERYICFSSGECCDIRKKYEKQLNEDIQKQYKPTGININDLLDKREQKETKSDQKVMDIIDEIFESMDSLRIDVDAETHYCDPTGELRRRYERANEMLDDCISIVKKYCDSN